MSRPEDGRVKLHVMRAALRARQDRPAAFRSGAYCPLRAAGPAGERVVAFARGETATVIAWWRWCPAHDGAASRRCLADRPDTVGTHSAAAAGRLAVALDLRAQRRGRSRPPMTVRWRCPISSAAFPSRCC
jgi:hypothetical protein